MHANAKAQLTVEVLDDDERVRLIRVAGRLDRGAAAGLLRLVDVQLDLLAAGRCVTSTLIIDVEAVSSFEPGGLETMRHARHQAGSRGVDLCLAGCSGRFHLLPLRAAQLLCEFSRFPTVEVALAARTRIDPAPPPPEAGSREATAEAGDSQAPQIVDGLGVLGVRRRGPSGLLPPTSRVPAARSTPPVGAPLSRTPAGQRRDVSRPVSDGARPEIGYR